MAAKAARYSQGTRVLPFTLFKTVWCVSGAFLTGKNMPWLI